MHPPLLWNKGYVFVLFRRAFRGRVHRCSSVSGLRVLGQQAACCREMEKAKPPVVRSLDGSELKDFAVPEWAWPYFRCGPYTLHELPPTDASVGRTRTVSAPFCEGSEGASASASLHQSRSALQGAGPAENGAAAAVDNGQHQQRQQQQEPRPPKQQEQERCLCGGEEQEPYFHLLHDVLMHPGAVDVLQYLVSENRRHLVVVCAVGRRLCGHKGVVHGGFTATLLDNTMGMLGHAVFPRTATKTLSVRYLRPFVADTQVIVDAVVESIGRRSCHIAATVVGPVPHSQEGAFPTQQKHRAEQQTSPASQASGQDGYRRVRDEVPPLPPLEEGLWVVATGTAEMVDVSAVWAGL